MFTTGLVILTQFMRHYIVLNVVKSGKGREMERDREIEGEKEKKRSAATQIETHIQRTKITIDQ